MATLQRFDIGIGQTELPIEKAHRASLLTPQIGEVDLPLSFCKLEAVVQDLDSPHVLSQALHVK